MTRHPALLFAAGAAGWMMATAALAHEAPAAPTVRVSYADLDLTREDGVARLYARLRHAAAEVCGESATRDLAARAAERRCTDRALGEAIDTVHRQALAAEAPAAASVVRRG